MWDVSYENFGESGNSGEFGDSGESGESCESESESRVVLGFPELLPTFLFIQGMLFQLCLWLLGQDAIPRGRGAPVGSKNLLVLLKPQTLLLCPNAVSAWQQGQYIRWTQKVSHFDKESICHHVPQHRSVRNQLICSFALSVFSNLI